MAGLIAGQLEFAAEQVQFERTTAHFLVDEQRPQVRESLLALHGTLCLGPRPDICTLVEVTRFAMAVMSWRGVGGMKLPARCEQLRARARARAPSVARMLVPFPERASRTYPPRLPALIERLRNRVVTAAGGARMDALTVPFMPLGKLLQGLARAFAGMRLPRRDGFAPLLAAGSALPGTARSSLNAAVLHHHHGAQPSDRPAGQKNRRGRSAGREGRHPADRRGLRVPQSEAQYRLILLPWAAGQSGAEPSTCASDCLSSALSNGGSKCRRIEMA